GSWSGDPPAPKGGAPPPQAPARYFSRCSAERSSRACKNRSFARGFHVVMVGVRSGRKCPHLSVREIRAACARKKMIRRISSPNWSLGTRFWGQLFRQLAEQPGSAQRPRAVGGATAAPQRSGGLWVGKSSKIAQLYQRGRVGIVAL